MEEEIKERPKTEPEPVKVKKKANVPAIILGILMVVCAGVAVFFGIKYFEPKENSCERNCQNEVNSNKSEEEAEKVTTATMAEDYNEVMELISTVTVDVGDNNWSNAKNSSGLTYKPEWLNSFIPMRFDIEKEVVDQNRTDFDTAESNMDTLKTKLENVGFSSLGILPHLGSAGPEIYGYLNSDSNIVCGMYGDAKWKDAGVIDYYYISLACAKTDWTWLTDSEMALASELTTAYYEKEGEYPTVIYGLNNSVKNSQYAPYQTLMVEVGGAAGLFYRTAPEEKWQFFAGTQSPLDCSDYNTDDLKKAYLGEVCYNGSVESTVQL